MKLALGMIVKGTDDEAKLLDKCLTVVAPYVDGIFITSTHKKGQEPNKKVSLVCAKHNAKVSYFQWCNDFSAARNFNLKQIPKEFDYWMWCDADDTWQNLDKLRSVIEENGLTDAFAFWYYYDHDENNNPTVVHKKTQVLRNDDSVEWIGKLHEDFKENRSLIVKFVDNIQRVHLATEEHILEAQKRNVEISESEVKGNENDPRVYFNLANSYFGAGKLEKAQKAFKIFIKDSGSDEEKYIAYQRLSSVESNLGNKDKATEALLLAIGMFPELPDAYNNLGYLHFENKAYDQAEKYLLLGLGVKPKYHKMIVFNPRDYDYNPMMALAKVYFNKSRPDYALPLLKGCSTLYPKDEKLKGLVKEMALETKRLEEVIAVAQKIESYAGDKDKVMNEINNLPVDLQSHPAICRIRNQYIVKETSTGKDIAYFCGETHHTWNPELFKTKGFGGSEEAVINLAREWAKKGYNVTVFNSCGLEPMTVDGVTYKPYWYFNPRDKYDHLIFWRTPRLADSEINCENVYIDLHDVIPEGEFTPKRLARINKIFVKTKAHRDLFPNVPDNKFAIIPNGMDFELFNQKVEKDPYLLVNTSSPDRSMDVLPKLFKMVKEHVPQARLKWAYGWDIFDNTFSNDKKMMEWKHRLVKEIEDAGIESLGKIPQKECAQLYIEGRILAYPSEFFEIDCISVKKAQACGCVPITTDFAAFDESVQFGTKVHSKKTNKNWAKPYQLGFGIEDEKTQQAWVDAVVTELEKPMAENQEMMEWTKKFDWKLISSEWIENLK